MAHLTGTRDRLENSTGSCRDCALGRDKGSLAAVDRELPSWLTLPGQSSLGAVDRELSSWQS